MRSGGLCTIMLLALLLPTLGSAKDKKGKTPTTLPPYVLQARTVAVIIDPEAGESIEDPQANRVAQHDVETALLNWGRYQPIMSSREADLIIVVRRGTGKVASGTIHDPRQGNRPGVIEPTDNGINIGVRHGREYPTPGQIGDASQGGSSNGQMDGRMDQTVHPQATIGGADDALLVYEGKVEAPLDATPAWRYEAKNSLKPHSVPAVEEFRKAVAEAENMATKQP